MSPVSRKNSTRQSDSHHRKQSKGTKNTAANQRRHAIQGSNFYSLAPREIQSLLNEQLRDMVADPGEPVDLIDDDQDPCDNEELEPADELPDEDNPAEEWIWAAYDFDPGTAVFNPGNAFVLDITSDDLAYFCRFRKPEWFSLEVKRYMEYLLRIETLFEVMGRWLERHAQPFLSDPTPFSYALAQGSVYEDYCDLPLITRQGLIGKVLADLKSQVAQGDKRAQEQLATITSGKTTHKAIKAIEAMLSRLQENVWLVWRDQKEIAPLTILFSEPYRAAWVRRGLSCYSEHTQWHDKEYNEKALKGISPLHDSPSNALTRLCKNARLPRERLDFTSESPTARET